jgi:hypothetical protein
MRFVVVEEGHKAVFGREIEVLRSLRIDWTGARSHIKCPYPGHADRNPSWRWDRDGRKAFCTCTSTPLGIFDVWMKIKGGGFAEALVEVMLVLGRTDLVRDSDDRKKKPTTPSETPKSAGCTLSAYGQMKGLPANWLHDELGLRDVDLDLKGSNPFKGPAVEIPYRGVDNPPIRWRTALTKTETGYDDRFRWKFGSKSRPYGVDRLPEAKKQGFCLITEGESDCHTLWYAGFPALGIPGNTNWNDARDAALLADIGTVYLIVEPDKGGQVFLGRFQRSVLRPKLKVIYFDENIAKDPSELFLLNRDGFKTALQAMIDKAVPYAPPARERRERQPDDDDNRPGQPLDLPDREPWAEAVNGAVVLDEVISMIRRYVVLSEDAAASVALWIAASYAFDSFYIFPRLMISAPTKGAGKSTLIDVIEQLVNRPLSAANITAGALFRTIDAVRPTMLLDEADTYVPENEALRNVLDSGHKRNGVTIRSVEGGKGDYWPRAFSTYCPLVLATIGRLHGTIEDRSIIIGLQRRRQDEHVESFRGDRVEPLNELGRKLTRFAKDVGADLAKADPTMPDGIYNRQADNWRPLLSLADAAGGIWPEVARQVAVRMNAADDREDPLTMLLGDIRDAFDAGNTDKLLTNELVATLKDREDRLYDEQKLTTHKLAARLRKLKIKSGWAWINGKSERVYEREKFSDSFARYLKPQQRET